MKIHRKIFGAHRKTRRGVEVVLIRKNCHLSVVTKKLGL